MDGITDDVEIVAVRIMDRKGNKQTEVICLDDEDDDAEDVKIVTEEGKSRPEYEIQQLTSEEIRLKILKGNPMLNYLLHTSILVTNICFDYLLRRSSEAMKLENQEAEKEAELKTVKENETLKRKSKILDPVGDEIMRRRITDVIMSRFNEYPELINTNKLEEKSEKKQLYQSPQKKFFKENFKVTPEKEKAKSNLRLTNRFSNSSSSVEVSCPSDEISFHCYEYVPRQEDFDETQYIPVKYPALSHMSAVLPAIDEGYSSSPDIIPSPPVYHPSEELTSEEEVIDFKFYKRLSPNLESQPDSSKKLCTRNALSSSPYESPIKQELPMFYQDNVMHAPSMKIHSNANFQNSAVARPRPIRLSSTCNSTFNNTLGANKTYQSYPDSCCWEEKALNLSKKKPDVTLLPGSDKIHHNETRFVFRPQPIRPTVQRPNVTSTTEQTGRPSVIQKCSTMNLPKTQESSSMPSSTAPVPDSSSSSISRRRIKNEKSEECKTTLKIFQQEGCMKFQPKWFNA